MARWRTADSVVKRLFALSGNRCAFPDCDWPLVGRRGNLVAEICHIEAAEPGGPRFNPRQTDEQRRAFENLMIMCPNHHAATDDVRQYSVTRLRKMKAQHERAMEGKQYRVPKRLAQRLSRELQEYWSTIGHLHQTRHAHPDLRMAIDHNATFEQVIEEARDSAAHLENLMSDFCASDDRLWSELERYFGRFPLLAASYVHSLRDALTASSFGADFPNLAKELSERIGFPLSDADLLQLSDYVRRYGRIFGFLYALRGTDVSGRSPFFNRNWELHHLGTPNGMKRLRLRLDQLEILYLGEYMRSHPHDKRARARLNACKKDFEHAATHTRHTD